jgi:hypothetical protein
MKNLRIFIASVIFVGMLSSVVMAQSRANIGFGFGVNFQEHQKANLKQAGLNFFRVYFKAEENLKFFLHTENGSFMVEEGANSTEGTKNSEAIGASMEVIQGLNLDFMLGTTSIHVNQGVGTFVPAAFDSADPFAEIGIRYSYTKNNASLDIAYSYRHHVTARELQINNGLGVLPANSVNKFSVQGLSVGISYLF